MLTRTLHANTNEERMNMSRYSLTLVALLCLLPGTHSALAVPNQASDPSTVAMQGFELSAPKARSLEQQILKNPNDVTSRIKLLGYYQNASFTSKEASTARQNHILWLIRNRPEHPVHSSPFAQLNPDFDGSAYETGKKAWIELLKRRPKEAVLLGNAASYFLLYDDALAEGFLQRAESADPQNSRWPSELGHLYQLGLSSKSGEGKVKAARKALAAYERALKSMPNDRRETVLDSVAKASIDAGDIAKAKKYGNEMLRLSSDSSAGSWNYGNMLHHGHLIMGLVALREGNLDAAKQHLRGAGDTPGSPQLDSFGPNMSLAKELLEKGERQIVLDYFKQCARFWGPSRNELVSWAKEVRAGKIPDFGPNLDY